MNIDMSSDHNAIDPSSFNDPVAMQTDWTPANDGGTNAQTHELVMINSERMEFQATIFTKLFNIAILVMGLGLLFSFIYSWATGELSADTGAIMSLLLGIAFSIFGGAMLYIGIPPIVFDKKEGVFWKERGSQEQILSGISLKQIFNRSSLKDYVKLEQIYAIQLISEFCRGHRISYYSYELNLVLENGHRINVLDHGDLKKIRADAESLSYFLNKPVWDAIDTDF